MAVLRRRRRVACHRMADPPLLLFWRRVDGRSLTRQPLVVRSVAHAGFPPHVQEDSQQRRYAKLQWTVRGSAHIRQDGTASRVQAGDITWWPADREHWARAGDDGWECWWFTLMPDSAAWPLLEACGLGEGGSWPGGPCPDQLFDALGRAAHVGTAAAEEEAGALAYRLFAMAARLRRAGEGGGLVDAALRRIAQRWSDPAFSIAGLAVELATHRSRLSRAFTTAVGVPPSDHLLRLRLSRAASMLRTSDLPVQRIAERCGFADASYFARSFRAAFASAPRAYRALRDG